MTTAKNSKQSNSNVKKIAFIVASIGCLTLLCLTPVVGGTAYWFIDQNQQLTISFDTPSTPQATPLPPVTPSSTATATGTTQPSSTNTPMITPTIMATSATTTVTAQIKDEIIILEPFFDELVFALKASEDDFTPIDPDTQFEEGITEIHAIFEYEGMSADKTWERVWYRNSGEMLRNTANWSGQETGRFDYFLDASGEPLPNGQWLLELYIENKLMVTGSFTIGQVIKTEPTTTPTRPRPTRVTRTVTPTPTASTQIVKSVKSIVTATPAPSASLSNQVYQLVYPKWDGVQHSLYLADTNGQNESLLITRAAGPSWSADGQQLFFFGEEGIDRQFLEDGREFIFDGISNGLVVMSNASARPDMADVVLTQEIKWKQGTARTTNVSPNGKLVAFDAKFGGSYRIFFVDLGYVEQFLPYEIQGEQADWSPDNQQIVYRSGRDGVTGVWVSNMNDTGHRLLTNNSSDSFPAWSPDGKTVVFSREIEGNLDLYAVDIDGDNLRRLTNSPGADTLPIYTPSGDIIYRSTASGYWAIWKMTTDGTGQTEIIANAGVGPDWAYSRMDVH
ncbi:hypothetical protein QUF64_01180 [Anaerolineales bacterium HSG6]|nr:hypothetical protein [Anaerolineales bacterium HSG6]MDM8531358.1 hypothetical protein [Anaerolineales bacterium HSG25]